MKRAVAVVLLALALSACATVTPPAHVPVPGEIALEDVPGNELFVEFLTTVYPTPRRAEYGDRLLPLTGAHRVDETSPDFDEALGFFGIDAAWSELGAEGYAVAVGARDGRTLVLAAGRDAAGRDWAAGALAQVSMVGPDGAPMARECRVTDIPAFGLRGSKRPEPWEIRYRANFAWGARDDDSHAGRILVAYDAPGSPLDATPSGVRRVLDAFAPWKDKGVRLFALKFDDVGFGLTPRANLAYGSYPRALSRFVEAVRTALLTDSPEVTLYLLPQTYWWNDERLVPYAKGVRQAGGLDSRIGLVMTGPEIISSTIDAGGMEWSRRAFGLTGAKGLIYDNLGREGDWGPLMGRDPRLRHIVDGVFGERGTPVHRLTRLDWLWNPDTYDPERSFDRAVFELAGPEGYDSLRELCLAFRRAEPRERVRTLLDRFAASAGRDWRGPVERDRLLELLDGDLQRIEEKEPEAVPTTL